MQQIEAYLLPFILALNYKVALKKDILKYVTEEFRPRDNTEPITNSTSVSENEQPIIKSVYIRT